jgi:hypothetical protein
VFSIPLPSPILTEPTMKITFGLLDSQVLQRIDTRGASAVLIGACETADQILATISNRRGFLKSWRQRPVGKASGGIFRAKLFRIPAGGPYNLVLKCGKETTSVHSFYVGDVWILAGQSNMEGIGNMSGKAKPHPLVSTLSMRRVWRRASEPLHILAESPDGCHHGTKQCSESEGELLRRSIKKGTGVGLFFAREMIRRTGVPQGLICTAHGGTSMHQWTPRPVNLQNESMYASMLASVRSTRQPVAGILWYQGESDATAVDAPLYSRRMQKLVASLRRDLRQLDLSWMTVQIGKVFNRPPSYSPWNAIQEEQRLLPSKIERLATVAVIDLAMDDGIHIAADAYPTLARRLARAAARIAHGDRRELPPPQPRHIEVSSDQGSMIIKVEFDHVVGGLQSVGPAYGFVIMSKAGEVIPIIMRTIPKKNVAQVLLSDLPPKGAFLTYGGGTSPICNMTDRRGEAVPAFGPVRLRMGKACI